MLLDGAFAVASLKISAQGQLSAAMVFWCYATVQPARQTVAIRARQKAARLTREVRVQLRTIISDRHCRAHSDE